MPLPAGALFRARVTRASSCTKPVFLLEAMASNANRQDRYFVVNKNNAAKISDAHVVSCHSSNYVKPLRLEYLQNGLTKKWDYLRVHDSVAILLFNTDRDVFILVRQFRPAVYASKAQAHTVGQTVDMTSFPGSLGMTFELCAGIVDKDLGLQETAKAEILEETGYDVPLDKIKRMTKFRSSVGITGSSQTLFYAEVTDSMKASTGGGIAEEGERIEVIELPLKEANDFIFDENIEKPGGLIAAFLWYFRERGITSS